MFKIITIIATLFVYVNINAQYIVQTQCKSDVEQWKSNSNSRTWYSKLDFKYDDRWFGDNGRIYKKSFNRGLNLIYFDPYLADYSYSSCSEITKEVDYFGFGRGLISINLYKDGRHVCTIIDEHDYSSSASVSNFRQALENYELPGDIIPGGGYKIKVYVNHKAYPSYYNPFEVGFSFETGTFTIGETSEILSPDIDDNIELNSTLKWNKIDDAQYRLIIGNMDSKPNFTRNSQGAYVVTNSLYDSGMVEDTTITIPDGILDFDTNYYLSLITSFNGVQFRIEDSFSTRNRSVKFEGIDFYDISNQSEVNPENYLIQGKPIRFKARIKNEFTQNLLSLSAKLRTKYSGVEIVDSIANYSSIESGKFAWSYDEFEIIVADSVPDGRMLDFEIVLSDKVLNNGIWKIISHFQFHQFL